MQYYDLTKMVEIIEKHGILKSRDKKSIRWWLQKQIRKGNLTLPKWPFNNRYKLTEEMIDDAVEALKTRGKYHYEEHH